MYTRKRYKQIFEEYKTYENNRFSLVSTIFFLFGLGRGLYNTGKCESIRNPTRHSRVALNAGFN